MVSQLKQGLKVESEHIGTWSWVKKQCKMGKCPSTDSKMIEMS
jgi:nucleoid DNA-binding protein